MVIQKNIVAIDIDSPHLFALYSPGCIVFGQRVGAAIAISDQEIVHRVIRVLKLRSGDSFILFDRKRQMAVTLLDSMRQEIRVFVVHASENKELLPRITFLLPLLKKEALEEAVYSLAELGVNDVQLIKTEKSRASLSQHEMQRLDKIIISAAEQAKQYAFPEIYAIKSLQETINDLSLNSDRIVFDMSGKTFFEIHKKIVSEHIYLIAGPEGGLTKKELLMIKEQGFKGCSLTPTVLRALQAVAVGAALFRIHK